jgi:hypothetical protein
MPTCDRCDRCPENALLVDRANPADGWILKKMEQLMPGPMAANANIGCGDTMPVLQTASDRTYDADDKRCLTDFFLHVAMSTPNPARWPCTIATPDGGTTDAGTSDGGT